MKKCELCDKTIADGTTSYHMNGKRYCSNMCFMYDSYPTKEEYLKSLEGQ